MEKIIKIKDNEIITIRSNSTMQLYSYVKNEVTRKSSFNKYAFIEYLKGLQVPKKYINQIEKGE